jgi:YtkA-like protein
MRTIGRLALGAATLAALSMAAAGIALAGNFGAVTFVDGTADPPTAGEAREIRFSLLQHGVTPINDGTVALTATLPGTDELISVPATNVANGEWAATVTFPVEGDWQVRVTHSVFETSPASTLAVASAGAAAATVAQPWTFVLIAVVALLLVAVSAMAIVRSRREAAPTGSVIRAG